MEKTADPFAMPVVEQAEALLDRYRIEMLDPSDWVFPILEGVAPDDSIEINRVKEAKNALANKYLKKLAKRAEIEKHVTFHLARNAAAWQAYKSLDDIYKVSKFLGHRSVQQTEEYLQGFDDDSLEEDFRNVFSPW
jgi:integrase